MDAELQHGMEVFLSSATGGDEPESGRHSDSRRILAGSPSSSRALALRLRSEGFTNVHEYALLPSAAATHWVIPIEKPSWAVSGLRICVPFKRHARILKGLLVPIARTGWKGWTRDRMLLASREPLRIESLVHEVTGEAEPVFAFLLGTAGRFRKLTVQVMRQSGEVLGYLKLPLTPEASDRIRHEATVIEHLQGCAALRGQIPQVLYAGAWGDKHILFESAASSEFAPAEFGSLCREFLDKLWNFKRISKPGRALVEQVGTRWKAVEAKLDSGLKSLGAAALAKASHTLENVNVQCSISHGDFAPWNNRLLNRRLYVFDWESASECSPRLWDVFHYHAQVNSLLRRRMGTGLEPHSDKSDVCLLLLYLLHSASNYLEENSPGIIPVLDYRRTLIRSLL